MLKSYTCFNLLTIIESYSEPFDAKFFKLIFFFFLQNCLPLYLKEGKFLKFF